MTGIPMIDIHAHIIPGVDDGPRTMAESLEMLALAAASGTTEIVATPHASFAFPFDEPRTNCCSRPEIPPFPHS